MLTIYQNYTFGFNTDYATQHICLFGNMFC